MKNIFYILWRDTLGYFIHHTLFRVNYFLRFHEYEYVYHLLVEELKSDTDRNLPQYRELRHIIGTGGTELFGCHGITDKKAAQKYEKVFKKYGIVCSYDSNISQIYQRFKDEFITEK